MARDAVGAGLGLTLQPVMAGARLGIGRALAVHGVAQFVEFGLQRIEHRQPGCFGIGCIKLGARFRKRLLDAALCFIERAGLGQLLGDLALMRGQRAAGEIDGGDGGAVAPRASRAPCAWRISTAARAASNGSRASSAVAMASAISTSSRGQPVALGQALGGGTRRIGGGGEPVPAPDVALAAKRGAGPASAAAAAPGPVPSTRRRCGTEAALQGGGRLDEAAQRLSAGGQGRGLGQRRQAAPVHRRTLIGRGVDVIAQRRTECRLIAMGDR